MTIDLIESKVEYALYALAVRRPELFREAELFGGGMLVEDRVALARVRALLAQASVLSAVGQAHGLARGNLRPIGTPGSLGAENRGDMP